VNAMPPLVVCPMPRGADGSHWSEPAPLPGLRAACIAELDRRISRGFHRPGLERDLQRLIDGEPIQLHHNDVLKPWRPEERLWSLYELRGDRLVGVPTWKPGQPNPPATWTVPIAPGPSAAA
jgi:hypothetical protein